MGTIINNSVTNIKSTPGIMTGLFADRPAAVANGVVYLAIDTLQIFSYDITVPGWVTLGGGGGATPNLQQVCTVGNSTNTFVIIDADDKGFYARDAAVLNVAAIQTSSTWDSGFLLLKNKNSAVTRLSAQFISSGEYYELPERFGATIADITKGILQTEREYLELVDMQSGSFTPVKLGMYEVNLIDLLGTNTFNISALNLPGGSVTVYNNTTVNFSTDTGIVCRFGEATLMKCFFGGVWKSI